MADNSEPCPEKYEETTVHFQPRARSVAISNGRKRSISVKDVELGEDAVQVDKRDFKHKQVLYGTQESSHDPS